jgi:acyl-CoA synthetase (AMP-forming)/AMP-acid ligase II
MLAHLYDLVRRRAETYPTAIAVGGQQGLVWRTLDSRELLALVDRLADELAVEGVRDGDPVVLWAPNHWRTPRAILPRTAVNCFIARCDPLGYAGAGRRGVRAPGSVRLRR